MESTQVRNFFHAMDRLSLPWRVSIGELSIAFLNKEEMCALHAEYLDDPGLTDVITFPGEPLFDDAGEICVCPEVALKVADERKLDFSEELSLYLAHGWLHLAGLGDKTPSERRMMRSAERQLMQALQEIKVIPDFQWHLD